MSLSIRATAEAVTNRVAKVASLLLAVISVTAPVCADGFIYVSDHKGVVALPRRGRPIPPPRPHRRHFPMKVTRHRVAVEIDDTVVRTRVEETFHNPHGVQLEGTYMFPLPENATISAFKMKIGGKEVAGEILEKDKARGIYEQIVRRVQDPGLLEYVERGLFRASVFPIPPRGGVDVTIEYAETVEREQGVTRYVYPLDTGKYATGPYQDVVVDVKLRSAEPIRSIQCPSHDVAVTRKGDKEARVSLEAKTLQADTDFVLIYNVGKDTLAPVLLTHRDSAQPQGQGSEEQGTFYLSITPRPEKPEKVTPKDLIFVIDTSGSMLGKKIDQVKKALTYCVSNLNEADRFSIVDFSTEARRFRPQLMQATAETRGQALKYIEELKARGGTNIEEAMRLALQQASDKSRLQLVVFLTDGEPTIGVVRPTDILKSIKANNAVNRRIFVFGVGEDLNAKLLDEIVRDHHGAAEFLASSENIEVPLANFFDKVDSPVLTDLSIEFKGGGVVDLYPRPLPDLFHGEQLELFGRYTQDGNKTVLLRGKFQGEQRVFEYAMSFKGAGNPHVPTLWAAQKIGYLIEQMRLAGETKEVKSEIIRLSKRYGIITPFTSYLILEEDRQVASTAPGAPELRRSLGAARDALLGPRPTSANARRYREVVLEEARKLADASGKDAVDVSRRLNLLKNAKSAQSIDGFAYGGAAGRFGTEGQKRREQEGVRVKKSGAKTFYLQDQRWIDSAINTKALEDEGQLVRVTYLSEEYFALLKKYKGIGKMLSVGPEVSFTWKGKLISVVKSKA